MLYLIICEHYIIIRTYFENEIKVNIRVYTLNGYVKKTRNVYINFYKTKNFF